MFHLVRQREANQRLTAADSGIYTTNLASEITVLRRETEQSRFGRSSGGALRRSMRAKEGHSKRGDVWPLASICLLVFTEHMTYSSV